MTRSDGGCRFLRVGVTTAISVVVGILMVAATSTPALAGEPLPDLPETSASEADSIAELSDVASLIDRLVAEAAGDEATVANETATDLDVTAAGTDGNEGGAAERSAELDSSALIDEMAALPPDREVTEAGGNEEGAAGRSTEFDALVSSNPAALVSELRSAMAEAAALEAEVASGAFQAEGGTVAQVTDPRDVLVFNLLEQAIDLIDEALSNPNLPPVLRGLLEELQRVLVSEIGFCLAGILLSVAVTALIIAFLKLVVVVVGLIVTSPFVLLLLGTLILPAIAQAFRLYDAIKNFFDFVRCVPLLIDVPPVGDPDRAAAPTNLTADYDCLDNAIFLEFTDNSTNETGFRVRDSVTGFQQDFPAHSGTGPHTIVLPIFSPGQVLGGQHVFTVTALSEQGESAPSNPASVNVQCAA